MINDFVVKMLQWHLQTCPLCQHKTWKLASQLMLHSVPMTPEKIKSHCKICVDCDKLKKATQHQLFEHTFSMIWLELKTRIRMSFRRKFGFN